MITNEFILMDRVQKIKQIINHYGEENPDTSKEK